MSTLRETIELDIKSLCHYFDWEENSEQADAIRNVLIALTHKAVDIGRDITILEILTMKKTAYVEREPMLEPLQVVDASMQQVRSHSRLLQYVSVADITKLK